MNLYLYIPPASAHPAGCIKGTVFGLTRRYYAQNTFRRDYINFIKLLYHRLIRRGWDRSKMRQNILDRSLRAEDDGKNRLFLHFTYHPEDIPRKRIQELFEQHCGELLRHEINIARPTIAYSRPKNIGDLITKAKLHQAPGVTSSIILGEYKTGLAPP
jgi:hypothetical protein